ncbi:hypothetical protein ACJIZ3_001684 [Penstemon smallii]|uniref:NAD(P)H-quinone oxidoreductase subunit U, chloroplastic n=1 Tax=Penstemon smallii TaxID=265156 RepID=A0ABD3U4B5_9LAMI
MAASSATAAYSIAAQNHFSSTPRNYRTTSAAAFSLLSTSFDASKQPRKKLLVLRNSNDENATAIEPESESPVEVPKGPPSLISAINVDKALRGIAITDADHYGRLGLQRGCSYDQVTLAYKNGVTRVMNQGLAEEEVSKELDLLKESHSILSSVEERRLYDWSLARSGEPNKYMWPFEADITQTQSPETPPPQEPEDEEPTRLVGYFVFSWFMLSIALFIALNR